MWAFVIEQEWWNYPGFELWRFVNLLLFIAAALFIHHRFFGAPITKALRSRRADIKLELEKAAQERERAAAELREAQARVGEMDAQVAKIQAEAEAEVAAEQERIRQATELDIVKLKAQNERDVANMAKSAQLELRRFVAAESIDLAETLIRRDISSEVDARLIGLSAEQFRGNQN